MELPIQNLTNVSPALDKALSQGPAASGDVVSNQADYDNAYAAEANKTNPGSDSTLLAQRSREAETGESFSNGYARPSESFSNQAETSDRRELNIYQFANEQASGQLRDPEAAQLSNPGELVNQSFQSIGYFVDRDLQNQHRLLDSQKHDGPEAFATNPFIVSTNTLETNFSSPLGQTGNYGQQTSVGGSVTSENNNSKTGKVDEQLRGLASYMGDVMLFSYQATLISKVSQSFSSSVSTLMRGQ